MTTILELARRLAGAGVSAIPVLGLCAPGDIATPNVDEHAAAVPAQPGPARVPAGVFVPDSSVARAQDTGRRAHTNYVMRNLAGAVPRRFEDLQVPEPPDNPAADSTFVEYPASLACVYGVGPAYSGCVPTNNAAYNATGGSRAIALVLAYDNPTAKADLQYFATHFGFAKPKFNVVLANGNGACSVPPYDGGWALESALDIEYAFAMAPKAQIILVEACSNSYADLMYAITVANDQVNAYGGGVVSSSWGSAEWSTESTDWDWAFRSKWAQYKPVTFVVSSGDSYGVPSYPSSSPWVISAGATTINRDPATKAFVDESCWEGTGGGASAYETWGTDFYSGGTGPWTAFQYAHFGPSARRTPDLSFDGDVASGAYVRSNGAWYVVGGTSLSAPALAGIINNANNRLGIAPSGGGYFSNLENNLLYTQLDMSKEYAKNFYDVVTGSNGTPASFGWDSCTGVGSPRGKLGK
jgi:subtilase family serine protease